MKISLAFPVIIITFINIGGYAQVPVKPIMVRVEGGTFNMGSNQSEDEKPVHRVTISSFSIGKYEVTVAEYKAFCNATNHPMPSDLTPVGGFIDTYPMTNVKYN